VKSCITILSYCLPEQHTPVGPHKNKSFEVYPIHLYDSACLPVSHQLQRWITLLTVAVTSPVAAHLSGGDLFISLAPFALLGAHVVILHESCWNPT